MGEEDVRHAATRLRKLLRAVQFPDLHAMTLEDGAVQDLLRVFHFVLLDSSRAVATFILDKGYDLYGKTDARFVESAFRLMRDEFRYLPSLNTTQFLSTQFVARRLELVADIAQVVVKKQQELQRQKRHEEAVWSRPHDPKPRKVTVENHMIPAAVSNHAANILQQLQYGHATERRHIRQTPSTSTTAYFSATAPVRAKFAEEKTLPVAGSNARRPQTTEDNNVPSANENNHTRQQYDHTTSQVSDVQVESPQSLPQSCACSRDPGELKKAVSELSEQVSQLSSALLDKISSVETRLGRLETQVQSVQAAMEEQRIWDSSGKPTRHDSDAGNLSNQSHSAKTDAGSSPDTRRSFHVDSSCAWPPQPSVFERY